MQNRDVFCMLDGSLQPDMSVCANITQPLSTRPCNTGTCSTMYWLAATPWRPCSSPCMNGSDASLGITTRDEPLCMFDGMMVDTSLCVEVGLPKPITTQPCNRVFCSSSMYVWSTTPWTSCQSTTGCGTGAIRREVTCKNLNDTAVNSTLCANSGARPSSHDVCDTGVPCECTIDSNCTNTHALCDGGTHTCRCSAGWTGTSCAIVELGVSTGFLFNSSDPERQCAGVVDTNGVCCAGPIDRVTGACCGVNDSVSAAGRCCAGVLDACGVCGGNGIAVDVTGQCCASPLSPAGLCCGAAGTDSCGVCSGLNECPAVVSVQISDTAGMTA